MNIGILSIGNEVVKGRTVNTNASEISKAMIENGHQVKYIVTCMDIPEDICDSLRFLMERSDVIITSGGLGPTVDDLTIRAISECLNVKLVINGDVEQELRKRYGELGLDFTEERKKMAFMPEGAEPIKNLNGTAPGIFMKHNEKLIFSTPGVPREMRGMLAQILKILGKGNLNYISRDMKVFGIMESTIAPLEKEIMEKFQNKISIKSHPESMEFKDPVLTIEFYGYATDSDLEREIEDAMDMVRQHVIRLGGRLDEKQKS